MMLPPFVQLIFIVVLGAGLGSFASALAYRIPRNLSWTGRERSRCTSCKAVLTIRDLVPLLSWLMHKGRCRHCKAPVSKRYPLTEAAAMAMALCLWAAWGWQGALVFLIAAVPFLLAHILIDLEHMILPDILNIILGVIFVVFAVVTANDFSLFSVALALAAGPALAAAMMAVGWAMKAALRKEALGMGDIKFFVVAGWGIGFSYFPIFLMASGIIGVLTGLVWKLQNKGDAFPFGPAIIIAFFLCLLARGAGLWAY